MNTMEQMPKVQDPQAGIPAEPGTGARQHTATEAPGRFEEFEVTGDKLIEKVKEILHEGNVRRIVLRNQEGENIAEFPLTIGVAGVVLLPVWAALGAIAALVANLTIVAERRE